MAKKALLIGIEDYKKGSLKGCAADAEELFNKLSKHADGTRNFEAHFYSDTIQTREHLLEKAHELFESDPEIALFYFSGHGAINNLGSFLLTPDHNRFNKGVAVSDILQLASSSAAKSKVIILDCCYAGAAGQFNPLTQTSVLWNNTIILASSRANETSAMVGLRSIFTNLLLDALDGGAADLFGNVTPAAVYAHIDRSLGGWSQRPVFKANVDHLITLRKVDPPIPFEYLQQIPVLFPKIEYQKI
jgi:uncharacterized caspase-like protein